MHTIIVKDIIYTVFVSNIEYIVVGNWNINICTKVNRLITSGFKNEVRHYKWQINVSRLWMRSMHMFH